MSEEFFVSKDVVPLGRATDQFVKQYYTSKAVADLFGNDSDLSVYMLIEFINIYRLFFDYASIKNDIYIFATLARSTQEMLADYLYALNHHDSVAKVSSFLKVIRFGAHTHLEYLMLVKGKVDADRLCERPTWTKTTQSYRIRMMGGTEEVALYNLLCAYAHHSIPNERMLAHPDEIFMLRSYFLAKIIEYLYRITKTSTNKGKIKDPVLKRATQNYVLAIEAEISSWESLFSNMFALVDPEH